MNQLISVIIPVYKVEPYIKRCLDSVINQTYKNLEIILIDDGSPDKCGEICDKYANIDSRIRVIHQKNSGVSNARNAGLDIASGEYITFVDSDDYIDSNMYQALIEIADSECADIAIVGHFKENLKGEFIPYCNEKINCTLTSHEQITHLLSNKYFSCSCCDRIIKKELIGNYRFNSKIRHNEDLLFLYEIMKKSKKTAFSSTPYYYYCLNQGSASNSKFNDSMMGIIDVSDYIFEDIKNNFPTLIVFELKEFMRNNISCATSIVKADYKNKASIIRIRKNIKKYLLKYLKTNASLGYKISALLISINFKIFKLYIKLKK